MDKFSILTRDEQIFAERMLFHFMRGKSPAECAQAVLDDDARLLAAVTTTDGLGRYPYYVDGLRKELTRRVYEACNAA